MATRGARGGLGGAAQRGLLVVTIDVPVAARLKINADKVVRAAGNAVAKRIRERLSAGQDGDGSALPRPKSGGAPLNRTGKLIRSIKFQPRLGWVAPSTGTRPDVSKRARSNYGLMSIHISGVYTRRGQRSKTQRPQIDPLGATAPENAEIMTKAAERSIKRQIKRGEAGLVLELRDTFRRARRGRR